ncbi:MAG: hypothetical protein ACKV22_12855 [Bryobacteraceae bacterium]
MADPITSKTIAQVSVPKQDLQDASVQKTGESKFDQVRAQQLDQNTVTLPPEVTQISAEQKRMIESDLRKRLQAHPPDQIVRQHEQTLSQTRNAIHDLQHKVNALPKTSAFDPVRSRLQSIEAQYHKSEQLTKGLTEINDPRSLLQAQMQIMQLGQNVEIVGKVVEQVNTGVKQILQTQV